MTAAPDPGPAHSAPGVAAGSPPGAPPARGDAPGGHVLEQALAGGALGPVWRATGPQGEACVVKFCAVRDDPGAERLLRRFTHEAALLRRLTHPDIVRLRAFGADPRWSWMAFDFVEGPDLSAFTGRGERLPAAQAAGLVAQAAEALDHAHRRGIVHRDIKPANLRIDLARRRVCVLDFGIAFDLSRERSATGLSAGSPAYMAPELLAGQAPSVASDVFALGVTLFELLAGVRPWEAPSLGALLRAIAQEAPQPLTLLRRGLPRAWSDAVHDALHADPAQRPRSAAELAARLRAGLAAMDAGATG